VKEFIAARNVSFNVNEAVKIAEEKFSPLSREEPRNKLLIAASVTLSQPTMEK
jgi:hypothetical protein